VTYYLIKVFISAGIIVGVSQLAKTNVTLGALLNSLPLVSILAMLWLYTDTRDVDRIAALSTSTFWLVLPTLPMFLVLPFLLRTGWGFYPELSVSIGVMAASYLAVAPLLARFGITI